MPKEWNAEIVAIGSELLLGQIIDTNTSYLAARFQELGIEVRYSTQVGDDPRRMAEVLSRALKRSRITITTGGIGPTEDDLTREVIARITGRKLVFHPRLLRIIQGYFDLAGFVMAPNNRKQAYIPAGAQTLLNPIGTAPGFILETEKGHLIITVPGVPRELKRMWSEAIAPFLQKKMGPDLGLIEYKVLKVCGLGESRVDEQIGDLIRGSTNPVIGLLASPGEIRIRLTARGKNREATQNRIQTVADQIRERLGPCHFWRRRGYPGGYRCPATGAAGADLSRGRCLYHRKYFPASSSHPEPPGQGRLGHPEFGRLAPENKRGQGKPGAVLGPVDQERAFSRLRVRNFRCGE